LYNPISPFNNFFDTGLVPSEHHQQFGDNTGFLPPPGAGRGYLPPTGAGRGYLPPPEESRGYLPPTGAGRGYLPPSEAGSGYIPEGAGNKMPSQNDFGRFSEKKQGNNINFLSNYPSTRYQ
jgi:hypothetical protein